MKRYDRQLCGKNDPTFAGLTLYKDPDSKEIAAVSLPGSNSLYAPAALEKHIQHMLDHDEQHIRPEKGEFAMLMVRNLALSKFMEQRFDTRTDAGSNAAIYAVHQALRRAGAELGPNDPVTKAIHTQNRQMHVPVHTAPAHPRPAHNSTLASRQP